MENLIVHDIIIRFLSKNLFILKKEQFCKNELKFSCHFLHFAPTGYQNEKSERKLKNRNRGEWVPRNTHSNEKAKPIFLLVVVMKCWIFLARSTTAPHFQFRLAPAQTSLEGRRMSDIWQKGQRQTKTEASKPKKYCKYFEIRSVKIWKL